MTDTEEINATHAEIVKSAETVLEKAIRIG
jgi:hypothetical protein